LKGVAEDKILPQRREGAKENKAKKAFQQLK
jgi:hypothetical protein